MECPMETPPATEAPARKRLGTLPFLVVASVMLVASGLVHMWQDRRMEAAARDSAESPFPLANLPLQIGSWKVRGDDIKMDDKTIQIAGCSDYVTRIYSDEATGAVISVLVAYGPAEKLVNHTPAVCYPAVGFDLQASPNDRTFSAGNSSVCFRSFVFLKANELAAERVHVYSGFRHAGRWTPDSSDSRKRFRHEPGMFKIQVQRRLGPNERCDPGNPIEVFLADLVPELNRSILAQR